VRTRQRAKKASDQGTQPAEQQTAGSSWREIDRALAAGDERGRAGPAEARQGRERDATTRAKARLGLASWLSRGDCERAAAMPKASRTPKDR
jgi:hypothetical protein